MIDYSIAGLHADIVHALAIIESDENPYLRGDGDQAYGLLQQHPAFFQQYYGRSKLFPASVHHTWAEAEISAASSFVEMWIGSVALDLVVQAYNLGIKAVSDGKRNPDYLARFNVAYASVQSGEHSCAA